LRAGTDLQLFGSLGGTLEYFSFAPENLVVICDLPDNEAAAASSLAINNSGAARAHVTALLSLEEMDRASQVADLRGGWRVLTWIPPGVWQWRIAALLGDGPMASSEPSGDGSRPIALVVPVSERGHGS
jgi:hypothetical protein